MSGFSEDGQWWWDGQAWIATSQVVIPDLGVAPSPETSQAMANRQKLHDAGNVTMAASLAAREANPIAFGVGLWFLATQVRAFRNLRLWTLQQLTSATTHLLGLGEPMVAGETSLYARGAGLGFLYPDAFGRDLSIVVTAAHVLLLAFDSDAGQPRRVALAARAVDVVVEAPTPILSQPLIKVRRGPQTWWIRGTTRVIQPKPVVAAWKAAVSSYRASTASS